MRKKKNLTAVGASVLLISATVALSGLLAPAPAAAQLPHEDGGLDSCLKPGTGEFEGMIVPLPNGAAPEERSACTVGTNAIGDRRVVSVSQHTAPAGGISILGRSDDLSSPGFQHVNIDRCEKNSIPECDGDLLSWRTKVDGISDGTQATNIRVDNEPGIYRACGAPTEGTTQRWLCTESIRLTTNHPSMPDLEQPAQPDV